jgi:phosphocarrier protein HPr
VAERLTAVAVITNRLGLHARAAAKLVEAAARFQSVIQVTKDGEAVDARSILGLMMLNARTGTQIEVSAEGSDAREALSAMLALIDAKFGED